MPFWRKKYCLSFAVCGRALSCWKKHKNSMTSNLQNQLWSQNLIDITPGGQITVDYQQTRSKVVVNCAPDHDATAAEPVTFHNVIVGVSLSVASINEHSSVIMEQIETRLIAEDVIMPVGKSLVVLSKVIAKLPVTSCYYGSMIWSTAANTELHKTSWHCSAMHLSPSVADYHGNVLESLLYLNILILTL